MKPNPVQLQAIALGLAGTVAGGGVGYFAFFWLARHGLYALALPPALLGLGAGLGVRRRSRPLAIICAVSGLDLGLFTEWRFAPFVADDGLVYFLTHIQNLRLVTWLMLGLGTYLSYSMALHYGSKSRGN